MNSNDLNADAIRLLELGDFSAAIPILTEAIRDNPQSWEPLANRAIALNTQGETKQALADLNAAIKLAPKEAELFFLIGSIQHNCDELELAIENYSRAIALDPCHIFAFLNRGIAKSLLTKRTPPPTSVFNKTTKISIVGATKTYSLQDWLKDLDTAVSLAPDNPVMHYHRAMHLNDTNSKITGLKHAVSLDPEYYDAHFELGKMHLFVDDAEASEHFSRCLEFNANDARAFRKRALAKRELGDVPGAIEDLSSAMALEPGDGDDFFMRANLLILIERFGDAIEDCMFGLSAKPDDPAILSTMGFAYFKLGNAKVALDKLDRCISLDPYDFEAFVIRAAIHMDFGDYDRALSDLLSSDAIRPLFGDGLFYRAKYAEASGDTKLAISDYMKYVEEEAKCGFPDIAQMQHAQRRINDLRKMKRN